MRVGFDVDGVLANFQPAYIDRTVSIAGRDLFPGPYGTFDIVTWNYPESYGYTENEMRAVWKSIALDKTFWTSLSRYEDVTPAFREWLHVLEGDDSQDVYFITQRPGATAKAQTEEWLSRWLELENTPTVLVTGEKGLCAKALGLTHYLDDKTENLMDVLSTSPMTKTFRKIRTWNVEVPGAIALNTLSQFQDLLQ